MGEKEKIVGDKKMKEKTKQQETPKIIERLTREEMTKKYPNQYLGITNIQYENDDGVTIKSANIVYIDKTEEELFKMQLESNGGIICWFTNEETYQCGFTTSELALDEETIQILRKGDLRAFQSKYVIDYIMKDKGYTPKEAIKLWYKSKTKRILIDGEIDYTHLAPTQIYDELLMELEGNPRWLQGSLD